MQFTSLACWTNRLLALLVVVCLVVGPPRAASLLRAGGDDTEQKEDTKEDAKETGKEAECSLGAEFALLRHPWKHPELPATGTIPWASSTGRSHAHARIDCPLPRPPLSLLPKRQI